jgi:hypothetical protein
MIVSQKRVVPLSGKSGISEQKKLVEKFGGIPAMQQQDFPRGEQAVVSRSRDQEKKMSILLTSKSISVKCPLRSAHCPNEKGLVCVSQKDLRSTLEPLVQPVILSAYED